MAYTGKKLESKLYDVYTKSETDLSIQTNSTPTAVSDKTNTSTGYFSLPSGTSAERPASPQSGFSRYNTDTGSLEFYDGTNWIATNLIPTVNSVDGTIYSGAASSLTLNLTNATDVVDVKYYEGGVLLATDSDVTITSGACTVNVPAAVYGQSSGDAISITIFNQDGTPASNSINKIVVALPSGGTVTNSGGYTYHTFTSSTTFTNTIDNLSIEYAVVAGGGGGGCDRAGGGGAGGMSTGAVSLPTNNYPVVVGAGGARSTSDTARGANGGNSSLHSIVSLGGGGGGSENIKEGASGGSGGGGSYAATFGGAGTSGQGNRGGFNTLNSPSRQTGGGGGKSQAGTDGGKPDGGDGASWNGFGPFAGGGGGGECDGDSGGTSGTVTRGDGGLGGGGRGGTSESNSNAYGVAGTSNTGGGGGGGGGVPSGTYVFDAAYGGAGGSGIVIIRYQL